MKVPNHLCSARYMGKYGYRMSRVSKPMSGLTNEVAINNDVPLYLRTLKPFLVHVLVVVHRGSGGLMVQVTFRYRFKQSNCL